MFVSLHDVHIVPRGPVQALWHATMPLAVWSRLRAWIVHRRLASSRRRLAARLAVGPAYGPGPAAFEACAQEGAGTEFAVVEMDGRRFGAVYVDGRLNCLLPDLERL